MLMDTCICTGSSGYSLKKKEIVIYVDIKLKPQNNLFIKRERER